MSCFNCGGPVNPWVDCKPCYERNLARIEVARAPTTPAPKDGNYNMCYGKNSCWLEDDSQKCPYNYHSASGCSWDGNRAPTKPTESVNVAGGGFVGKERFWEDEDGVTYVQSEPAKWVPKVGDRVCKQGHDTTSVWEVLAVFGGQAWLCWENTESTHVEFLECIRPLPTLKVRKVRKQVEWQHKSGKKVWVFKDDGAPFPDDEWTPTGRTHGFEVEGEE